MRSLAQLQMAKDPAARAAMEQQFDLSDGADEEDEELRAQVRWGGAWVGRGVCWRGPAAATQVEIQQQFKQ